MTLQFSMVMTEQALAAVPLFVFMGIMMENAGLMERLFSSVQLMLSRVRGALFYAVFLFQLFLLQLQELLELQLQFLELWQLNQ